MTIAEKHQEVRYWLDKADGLSVGDIFPEEIDIALNRAQDIIVEDLYRKKDINAIAELITLEAVHLAALSTWGENAYYVNLSTALIGTFLYHWTSKSRVVRSAYPVIAAEEYVANEYITEDDAYKYIVSVNNRCVFLKPKVFKSGVMLYVLGDAYTTISTAASEFLIEYISMPARMVYSGNINTNLNIALDRKIVDLAVQIMLDPLESPRLAQNTELLIKEKL
jgi:hypothetical protein